MSTNHHERIEKLVDKALKQAAMGERYGFSVSTPSLWPVLNQQGQPTGQSAPAWFVMVTIPDTAVGEPDIGNGFPVYGVLPDDEDFRKVAIGLLDRCRGDRDKANASALLEASVSGDEILRRMRDGKDAA